MKKNYTVSTATYNDLEAMAQLLQFLFTQEADFTPSPNTQLRGLKLIMDNQETGQLLVIKTDEKCIGMVNLLYTISTAMGGKVAILEDMVIHPDFRNKGLGSILLKHAINFAQQHGCMRITLLTDSDNFKARNFYSKMGFVISNMIPLRMVL